jgi:hypothetical protein
MHIKYEYKRPKYCEICREMVKNNWVFGNNSGKYSTNMADDMKDSYENLNEDIMGVKEDDLW